jgi:hypothetical protein
MPRFCLTSGFLYLIFLLMALSFAPVARAAEPRWIRINSAHFSVLTDGSDKQGRDISLRLEQMRDVFAQLFMKTKLRLPEPLDVIALKSDEEYIRVAPLRQGQPVSAPGFLLPGEDRNYIVLDLSVNDSWRAVSREFALLFLSFNYPPTQDWFDEGFAEYFSSLQLGDNQARIGGDPTQETPWNHKLPGQSSSASDSAKSFVELLNRQWLPMPDLFTMKPGPAGYPPLFYAQSWIVMHYLISQDKLSQAGTYFGLVQIQKIPTEQAIHDAFGMTAAQFEQSVKDYFHSLPGLSPAPDNSKPDANSSGRGEHRFPAPLGPDDVGSSLQDVPAAQAQALVSEMSLRLKEHRQQGEKDLQTINLDPKTENAFAHRGLAWALMERNEFEQASEELVRAGELDARDPWTRYYLALLKFRASQSSKQPFQGVSNMMQDLLAVLDWKPDFAEALNLLALARLQGGGIHSAREAIQVAIQLSPRNEQYLLNRARIELAGKQWDEATLLLNRLKGSSNPQIAQEAGKSLNDLPTLKKYGVLPQPTTPSPPQAGSGKPGSTLPLPTTADTENAANNDAGAAVPAEPTPDRRKVLFLKGNLIRVDCSQSPVAILTIRTNSGIRKLRTDNYKSLLLVGADDFACEWAGRPVAVNYKAGGKADGDLVSLEVQ